MNKYLLGIITLILIITGVALLNNNQSSNQINQSNNSATNTTPSQNTDSTNSTTGSNNLTPSNPDFDGKTTTVKVAVLDNAGTSNGKMRGCDKVVLVNRTISETEAPLNTALETLFSIQETQVNGYYNFIAKTNDTLSFDRVTVKDGVASVYLNGRLSGLDGVCDDPRAQIQIEETALQFPSVRTVVIYLNGKQTILTPNESGMVTE